MKSSAATIVAMALIVAGSCFGQDKPRVFLQSVSHGNTWNARRDQSIEMAKDFEKHCPDTKVTLLQDKADYTVILNHIEVGLLYRDNQMEVADKNGRFADDTRKGRQTEHGLYLRLKDGTRLLATGSLAETPRGATNAAQEGNERD